MVFFPHHLNDSVVFTADALTMLVAMVFRESNEDTSGNLQQMILKSNQIKLFFLSQIKTKVMKMSSIRGEESKYNTVANPRLGGGSPRPE